MNAAPFFRKTDLSADLPALAALHNRVHPHAPVTEALLRHLLASAQEDELFSALWEEGERLVGAALAHRDGTLERPVRLELWLEPSLATPARRQALYAHALTGLPQGARALKTRFRETETLWLELLEREGFRELERQWDSLLDVTRFDETPFLSVFERSSAAGVRFTTVADLPDDEATRRLLYETIAHTLLPDVPFAEPLHIWPFETWLERGWRDPQKNPESWFLAFRGEELLGMSELRLGSDPKRLETGLTGVRRSSRRQGVALSLKLLGVRYARTRGVTTISTTNHSVNRPMLAINEALGFVKLPAVISFKKEL